MGTLTVVSLLGHGQEQNYVSTFKCFCSDHLSLSRASRGREYSLKKYLTKIKAVIPDFLLTSFEYFKTKMNRTYVPQKRTEKLLYPELQPWAYLERTYIANFRNPSWSKAVVCIYLYIRTVMNTTILQFVAIYNIQLHVSALYLDHHQVVQRTY